MTSIGVTAVILAIIFCLTVVATSIKLAAISLLCAATFSAPTISNRRRDSGQAHKRGEEESHDECSCACVRCKSLLWQKYHRRSFAKFLSNFSNQNEGPRFFLRKSCLLDKKVRQTKCGQFWFVLFLSDQTATLGISTRSIFLNRMHLEGNIHIYIMKRVCTTYFVTLYLSI